MSWNSLFRRLARLDHSSVTRAGGSPARRAAEVNHGTAPEHATAPPVAISQFQTEMHDRLTAHRAEFRASMEAVIEAAARNYKKMLTVAQTQPHQALRSSLTTHADEQLIRSLRHMLHNQEQFDSFIASFTKKIAQ